MVCMHGQGSRANAIPEGETDKCEEGHLTYVEDGLLTAENGNDEVMRF